MNKLIDSHRIQRIKIGCIVLVLVAAMHAFRIGSYLEGAAYIFYYSYASDIVMPFAAYFLLCMYDFQVRFIRQWYVKALLVFSLTTITEVLQSFGYYVLGSTFDYVDIFMFAIGVISAVVFDIHIFRRLIKNWVLPN